MERTRIGAVGCGYWGPNLIRTLIESTNACVDGVADLDAERRAHIAQRYPQISHVTADYRELFGLALDAAVISTPPETHFEIARDCLRNGLHVLVEKPLVTRSDEARELIALAEQRGLVVMVGHTIEYNPAARALKELVQSGELGQIFYVDAVRVGLGLFRPNLNVIWDLAPHDISVMNYLFDAPPVKVSAHGLACLNGVVEDVAYLSLTYPNDVLCHVRVSWLDPAKTRKVTVIGSRKMAVFDDVEMLEKLRIYDKHVDAVPRADTFGEFQFSYHNGNVVMPHIDLEEPLRLECEHFVDCVRNGHRPRTDGPSGLQVVEVIEVPGRLLLGARHDRTAAGSPRSTQGLRVEASLRPLRPAGPRRGRHGARGR
jgi:predicted dehydrogenase